MTSSPNILQKLIQLARKEWFLVAIFAAIGIASITPNVGKSGGILQINLFADVGIALIFFQHGLGLSFEKLKQGLMNWKIHVVVQIMTFVVFPIIWILGNSIFGFMISRNLMLGFCYLCALPSTVSSSVAFTGIARGNVPAAIFNATISGLIGIVMTPLIVMVLTGFSGESLSFTHAVIGIAKLLLLPLVLGQLCRPILHAWHQRNKKYTNSVDGIVILLLVYNSFCDSVSSGLWVNNGPEILVITLVGSVVILAFVIVLSTWLARKLGFNKEDEITTVFCGSKKTLASGVPMAKLIFGAHPALGLIMLPIIFFHQIQLVVCSILANKYAERN